MFRARSFGVVLFATLALAACATSAPGVMPANAISHVASVEIVEVAAKGAPPPPAFAGLLREAIIKEAAFYGAAGQPITLRVELQKVHFKNMVQALLIGDDNQAKGQVAVVDPATGQQSGTFLVQVNAERSSGAGASIASTVIGAFDPTGLVSMGMAAGSAASADINRGGTTAGLVANFASETLRQTFGDAKAKAVNLARQKQARAQ